MTYKVAMQRAEAIRKQNVHRHNKAHEVASVWIYGDMWIIATGR